MITAGHPGIPGKVILRHNQKTGAKKNIYTKAVNHRFVWICSRQAALLIENTQIHPDTFLYNFTLYQVSMSTVLIRGLDP